MKNIKYISIMAFAMLLAQPFVGCQRSVEPQGESQQLSVELQGTVNDLMSGSNSAQGVSTRLTETAFDDGDTISLYLVKYAGGSVEDLGAGAGTYVTNQLFKRSDGLFKSYNGSIFTHQYFPQDGSSVDIYAVHPYSKVTPTIYTGYKFAVKSNQSAALQVDYFKSDFMMAKRINIAPTAVPNKLVFNHLFSRVVINAKATEFLDGTKVASAKLLNTKSEATINLRAYDEKTQIAGSVVSAAVPTQIVPFTQATSTTGFDKTFSAIVPAQKWSKGASIMEVTLSNSAKHMLVLEKDFELVSGMEHVMNVEVSFGEQYAITDTVLIRPWGTTSADAAAQQTSDNKFHVALSNTYGVAVGTTTAVRIGVNGNRTFELKLTKTATVTDLYFEFRGVGNRPNGYPFKLTSIEMVNASGASIAPGKMAIDPAIKIDEPGLIDLKYDISNKTITK